MTTINILFQMLNVYISNLLIGLAYTTAGLIFVSLLNRMAEKRNAKTRLQEAVEEVLASMPKGKQ